MTKAYYVVATLPHNGVVKIIGPIKTARAAVSHGERWQHDNNDSPCWQVVTGERPLVIQFDHP